MPQSATDATRFTSTTPYASAKSPRHPAAQPQLVKQLPSRTPGPPGETPQEKVRRLRAAAAKARDANFTTIDKVIVGGRIWADRVHRFTALTLIALTGITGLVTAYAMGDMIVYNRRKRREYAIEQEALHTAAVQEARRAVATGTATEAQEVLLNSEKMVTGTTIKSGPGLFAQAKTWLFKDLKKEETGEVLVASEGEWAREGGNVEQEPLERSSDVLKAMEDKGLRFNEATKRVTDNENGSQRLGGPLDRLGTTTSPAAATNEESPKSGGGGWLSFMSRK